jgi:RND family efflux transporter MFP subunit
VVALAAVALAGCGKETPHKAPEAKGPPVAVRTMPVTRADWAARYEATGTVRARTEAALSAKVMGYVREVRAQAGDRVREGQVLAVLDARDLDTDVRRAEAAREEVKNALPEAEAAIAAAQAQADLAEATFRRMQELFQKKSVTNQEFDEAAARLKAAAAAREVARARRQQLDAKLKQAEQEVQAAGIRRAYSEVVAPFAGVITAKPAEPGLLAAPGVVLFLLERDGAFRFEAAVEESRLGAVRLGEEVEVTLDGLGRAVRGRVAERAPAVDPATRTGTVKIDLPALAELRSGRFGRAAFAAGTRSVLTVPAAAVLERGQIASVFVVEDGTARLRLVTLGARDGESVEVLSGLREGERVVTPAPAALADGGAVEVRP